jgi:hypothetical protein
LMKCSLDKPFGELFSKRITIENGCTSSRWLQRSQTHYQACIPQYAAAVLLVCSTRGFIRCSHEGIKHIQQLQLLLLPNRSFLLFVRIYGPPLWSSGQSSCLQIQRPGFDSRCYQIF